jgi:hemolysin activation/secretion protein
MCAIACAVPVLPGVAAEGPAPSFDILEYRVLGASLLDRLAIERAVYPHLGPGRSMGDVEAARDALVEAYRTAGYATVFIDIPEQDVKGGIVRLRVTEGRLARVTVSGAEYSSSRRIRSVLQSAAPGDVPRLPDLQAELASLQRVLPDRTIVPVLRSGRDPGTFDLDLRVDERLPLHATFELNDRYTADTSRLRASATLSYDNLFQRAHSASLQFQGSPEEPGEVEVFALTYVGRSEASRNVWALYWIDSNSDVAALNTLSVIGSGTILGGRYIVPLDGSESYFPSLTWGVDYKDFDEDVRLPDEPAAATPISYWVASVAYGAGFRRDALSGNYSTTLRIAPRGLGNTEEEFAFKRFRGRPNFAILSVAADVSVGVGERLTLLARMSGQYAPQPLVSNEQFSLGGVSSVRGYLEAETLADMGIAGTLEGALRLWPAAIAAGEAPVSPSAVSFFGFWDAGVASVEDPLPGQLRRLDLASVGAGLRFAWQEWLDGEVAWAYPLVPGPRTLDSDARWHFSVRASY